MTSKKILFFIVLSSFYTTNTQSSCNFFRRLASFLCGKKNNPKEQLAVSNPITYHSLATDENSSYTQNTQHITDNPKQLLQQTADELEIDERAHKKAWEDFSLEYHLEKFKSLDLNEKSYFEAYYHSDSTDYLYPSDS